MEPKQSEKQTLDVDAWIKELRDRTIYLQQRLNESAVLLTAFSEFTTLQIASNKITDEKISNLTDSVNRILDLIDPPLTLQPFRPRDFGVI